MKPERFHISGFGFSHSDFPAPDLKTRLMYVPQYSQDAPSPEEVAAWRGPAVLEFGTNWCPICQAAQPAIEEALSKLENVSHIKVEDGPGRRLGRSFRVKLWPTLIFLRDGQEVARVVRPAEARSIQQGLDVALDLNGSVPPP